MMYLVTFLLILALLALILLLLLTLYPVKVDAVFNSEQQTDAHVLLSWLYPFLKATLIRENNQMKLTVYLFNGRIYRKNLAPGKMQHENGSRKGYQDYINYARSLDLHHVRIAAAYGFEDPSVTGMVCGAIDMVSQAVVIEDFDNSADFISDRDYFDIEASAEVNAAVSLFRLLRKRSPHLHPHPYGEKITKH